jgi:2-polyprenyl-6-methoxyphenol hydroxylase-like FAD-dependent oxidoreductase
VSEYADWNPALTSLIRDSDTPPHLRRIYRLPAGHRWDRVPGVTLLGDAAHLQPPNGEGANVAMLDGAELARAILANPQDPEAALLHYEHDLFPRAAATETETEDRNPPPRPPSSAGPHRSSGWRRSDSSAARSTTGWGPMTDNSRSFSWLSLPGTAV